ncbi:MAG: hypothetical protein ABI740_09990 [Alphaproteobacteria bacterium]
MRFAVLASALTLAACSPAPQKVEAPKSDASAPRPEPETLDALAHARDWEHEDGKTANDALTTSARRILQPMSRSDAIEALRAAHYECTYGEASESYPDPMAVCTRSFATRACRMTWEISSTADKDRVKDVDGAFTRDCVGVADDWPEPVKSAIDDQLAPAPVPVPTPN